MGKIKAPAAVDSRMLTAALEYAARGWSLVPMRLEAKRPAVRWKRWQGERADGAQLRKWFARDTLGLAAIFGDVSGGLVSRDFDEMAAYDAWAAKYPTQAATLPTVATRRGRHVYAALAPGHEADVRLILGKQHGTGAIGLTDGELRIGVGCYSVLPPSIHPSGHEYAWLIALPDGPLPTVDLFAAGFLDAPLADSANHAEPFLAQFADDDAPCDREDGEHRDDRVSAGVQRLPRITEAPRSTVKIFSR